MKNYILLTILGLFSVVHIYGDNQMNLSIDKDCHFKNTVTLLNAMIDEFGMDSVVAIFQKPYSYLFRVEIDTMGYVVQICNIRIIVDPCRSSYHPLPPNEWIIPLESYFRTNHINFTICDPQASSKDKAIHDHRNMYIHNKPYARIALHTEGIWYKYLSTSPLNPSAEECLKWFIATYGQ